METKITNFPTNKKSTPVKEPAFTTEVQSIDRGVKYVQLHDAFSPLMGTQGALLTLSTKGPKAMQKIVLTTTGVEFMDKESRTFMVPFGNISFLEFA